MKPKSISIISILFVFICCFHLFGCLQEIQAVQKVEQYGTHELSFKSSHLPSNPYDTYLLKIQLTDPDGKKFSVDGFFDGDGKGGQKGNIWKVRICPYKSGSWTWETVPGDAPDDSLTGLRGTFLCIKSDNTGGVIADNQHFRYQNGSYTYLQGNFLDFSNGLHTTHTYMSELGNNEMRNDIIDRQTKFHRANKANIYFANKGDYKGQAVTPWVGDAKKNDKSQMDLKRWKKYDAYLREFIDNRLLAEMWFFADDSDFGKLNEEDRNRLFRYAMARTSAFSHTLYVIALEWDEGWKKSDIESSGIYLQNHNPWKRLISVHSLEIFNDKNSMIKKLFNRFILKNKKSDWPFSGQNWAKFIASQAGNSAKPNEINELSILMRKNTAIPHIDEEFGILNSDVNPELRAGMWANFCGGSAGAGTGSGIKAFMYFLENSKIPFKRMIPQNDRVQDGGKTRFCLAETGHHYLVYSQGGAFKLNVEGTNLKGYWLNPRDPDGLFSTPFKIVASHAGFTPPEDTSKDWVLWITDRSNLETIDLYPTKTGINSKQIIK